MFQKLGKDQKAHDNCNVSQVLVRFQRSDRIQETSPRQVIPRLLSIAYNLGKLFCSEREVFTSESKEAYRWSHQKLRRNIPDKTECSGAQLSRIVKCSLMAHSLTSSTKYCLCKSIFDDRMKRRLVNESAVMGYSRCHAVCKCTRTKTIEIQYRS